MEASSLFDFFSFSLISVIFLDKEIIGTQIKHSKKAPIRGKIFMFFITNIICIIFKSINSFRIKRSYIERRN